MATGAVSFGNTEKAFKSKGNSELKSSLWLFNLMGNPRLVKLFSKLTVFAIKIGLPIKMPIKATIFKQFCGGETIEESENVVSKLSKSHIGSILDYSVEGKDSEEDFTKTKNEILKIIKIAKGNPAIPYTSLKLTGIAPSRLLEKMNKKITLNEEEEKELLSARKKLIEICDEALKANVPVYFDAEESWLQNAIDELSEEMMKRNNRNSAVVLTTLQMYRWDRIYYLEKLLQTARKEKFFIGIKLVRGAYMEKENLLALQQGYRSPIQLTKEETDRDFDKAVDICLENIDIVTLCAGTHNEESSMHLINKMNELKIPNNHPHVYFSQLFGMSDHITFNLADAGYNVTKYLPYGPVNAVIPYLIRRASENTAISGQMSRELKLLVDEKKRRTNSKLLTAGKTT